MIVSWNWLKDYVKLDMPVEELTHRLTMAGLNLEEVHPIKGDLAIDLEVTSNRPDCLGHLGVAREISVLYKTPLTIPPARVPQASQKTSQATSIEIECPDLCPAYVARIIRGVKIGPSPAWLIQRLTASLSRFNSHDPSKQALYRPINNVADITNYVMMECGQPLHAFDFDKLHGGRIIVRRARPGEKITAIDQVEYQFDANTCVIADADRPVAIAGVMGGFATEISERTVNVLIEAADFSPLTVRNTARRLKLHSPSSYRFERQVDSAQIDWASRRCCELILQLAGGELLEGPVVAGSLPTKDRPAIKLRFEQIRRILGIEIPPATALKILEDLGLKKIGGQNGACETIPPSWRRDLTREADLIEEVARIHGYDNIPADVPVSLAASAPTRRDQVLDRVRETLTGAGFYEAITLSFTTAENRARFTPRGDLAPLIVEHDTRKHENQLRQSLIPHLLESRRENERQGSFNAQLFEIAKVYLKSSPGAPEREVEPWVIGLVSGRSLRELKGMIAELARRINRNLSLTTRPSNVPQFAAGRGAEVLLNGQLWGWLGELDFAVAEDLKLRDGVTVAELDLALLESLADLTPRFQALPQFPAIARDLNFVIDEAVTWQELEDTVRAAAGELLDSISFGGQYRGQQIPADKKSYLVTVGYRSSDRTLTTEEVDQAQKSVIEACKQQHGALLR
jgi:phenylalanyl-tRNA synthetase beta chain